jgi:hypothetical protein
MAAQACAMNGVPYVIFSPKKQSVLGGAQFSHIYIPFEFDIPQDGEAKLTYVVRGDAETYQKKVYGDQMVPFVSFGKVHDGKVVPAWSLTNIYDRLWELHHDKIVDIKLDLMQVVQLPLGFDQVFSSIPLKSICLGQVDPSLGHWFKDQPVRIYNEAIEDIPDNTIVYDGTEEHSYYRMSKIFGVGSTEWGGNGAIPPLPGVRTINKPIATSCDCFQVPRSSGLPAITLIGRFGTWRKGELTMHAFNRTIDTLSEMGATND